MNSASTVIASLAPSLAEHAHRLYIGGEWVEPSQSAVGEIVNPATEEPFASIAMGTSADIDRAVAAATAAFGSYSLSSREDRVALLERIVVEYEARVEDLAQAISQEMGAPLEFARKKQAPAGLGHIKSTLSALREAHFEEKIGSTTIVYEPIGVCGLITPWNWPVYQIGAKVAPALATGCTMVLKPSEIAPLSAVIFTEILDAAGVPGGVFNLVHGDGPTVGAALAEHPGVAMVSFTGSTRAGVDVARRAAGTVKRVTEELGGKSANIILDDADLEPVLVRDIVKMYGNCGQSCNAGTRILVPNSRMAEAAQIAKREADKHIVGSPLDPHTVLGPVSTKAGFDKVQKLIQSGIDQGATLVTGGLGKPEGLDVGYYVKPTVFADADNTMDIAQEEIFGPVLTLIGYDTDDDAVRIANDSPYGLAGMVSSADPVRARAVATRMRTGVVHINGASMSLDVPFGGYKQSGNGREFGAHGMREYLEVKALLGDS